MINYTFIIPVYNCHAYIQETIESLKKLGKGLRGGMEVLLIDDGSTDGSGSLCDSLACEQVWVIHQKNQGVSQARNVGIANARGEYVIFIDSDDTIDVEAMRGLLNSDFMHEKPDLVIYGCVFEYYAGRKLSRREFLIPPYEGMKNLDFCISHIKELYKANCLTAIWNKVVRREILINNDIYFNKELFLYEDMEFSLRLMKNCRHIQICKEPIYFYHLLENGRAGNRLKRLFRISDLVEIIDQDFIDMGIGDRGISFELFVMLAEQKIYVSKKNEIMKICEDFRSWICKNKLEKKVPANARAQIIYNHNMKEILRKKRRRIVRSKVGYLLKIAGIYQKLRKT